MTMSIPKEPEQVMKLRGGSVLGKKTILKSDHFPGCQNKRLSPQIDGAPNYRQAVSLHVHGVAIPTIDGIRNVLDHIGAQKNGKQTPVLWHNLREEPVVYINGRPFVLRDVERPFSNLEYTGINRTRVEQMEFRLKEDILLEAARYGNKILVTDELPDGQMVDQWEPVTHDSVKTPLEVYEELQVEGYLVDYERVPITDEKPPKEQDFDILVHRISQADINTEIVFNCQMGRGRTTTGMVIATLIYLNRIGSSGSVCCFWLEKGRQATNEEEKENRKRRCIPRTNSIGKVFDAGSNVTDNLPNSEEAIRKGEYAVIRSLIRGGVEGKRQVDKVIDKCASMQNLREAIATYRSSIQRQPDEMKREASLSLFVEYLERYYFLICFAVYIHTERAALRPNSSGQISFADWMRARPELYSILRRLLRRDPMGALGYASWKPSLMKIAESADGRPYEMGVVAALRNGEVLGSQTVLKSDHCPGCQNLTLPERVDGAPNFREVPGFPVYGVANPTINGIQAVIRRIGSTKGGRAVFWHNMREEPVIYINGKPFVLREVERPFKNMLEYTGIDRERVEKMEARLKEDILREADRYGGAIMVIHETDDGQIFDAWEHVSSEAIQTPLEVYKCLEAEGLPIKYARVPITDGKAPKSSDFDTVAMNIASASKDTDFVFNCQMGRGRTTTGTVIACLLKLRINYGRPIRVPLEDVSHEEVDSGSLSGEEVGGNGLASTSNMIQLRSGKEPNRAFGINDILLLWKITRLFDNGVECREALDAIIDRCSALQNIREAVLQYRKMFNQQHVEPRVRMVALNRGAEYLERYFRLIAFAAYLGSEAFDGFCGQGESRMTFKTWLHQRPEVQAMKWSIRLRPGRFFNVPEELRVPHDSQHGDAVMGAIVRARSGSVLGKGSILKMYFFPGQRTSSHIQIHGAPHVYKVMSVRLIFLSSPLCVEGYSDSDSLGDQDDRKWSNSGFVLVFSGGAVSWKSKKQSCVAISMMEAKYVAFCSLLKRLFGSRTSYELYVVDFIQDPVTIYHENDTVDGYPVYSMATPTIAGANKMLAYIGALTITGGNISPKVILTDLREEAVVYINGTPFVLRELNQPVDTLKHVGITGPVVEHLEARLKEDILAEVTESGGRMLLHREEYNPALNQSSIIGYWENILVDDVKTPAEVYTALKHEGYNIEYRRIPLTREREALASDVDAIQYCKDDSAGCYLFISHTGFGGVAYAMAITCLRLNAEGQFASESSASLVGTPCLSSSPKDNLPSWACDEEARKLVDYRDILSLTRVLIYGPKSKAEADSIIERFISEYENATIDLYPKISEYENATIDLYSEMKYLHICRVARSKLVFLL
ncbi:hypothetical protein HHK36_006519 [Tetracentron sinense]|uniref:Paladin n=1 Tax=Tetracentron sinense TaxID=13715 RepID=A0A835DKE4_TETSI|nr:hypothetical protein HHK36_006519 [Tetracentron sinense]